MTVVFAVRSTDGIVLAADSQATERNRGVMYAVDKIHPLGARGAWGGSGSRAVLLDVRERLAANAEAVLDAPHPGHALQDQIRPVLRHHYDTYIAEVPGSRGEVGDPSVQILAAAYDRDGTPWIVEVDPHCQLRRYEDVGFHAVGSGGALAQQAGALLAHFAVAQRPLSYGLLVAMRVLDAVMATALGVGGEPNLWAITPHEARRVHRDTIETLRQGVERWKSIERDALDDLLGSDLAARTWGSGVVERSA